MLGFSRHFADQEGSMPLLARRISSMAAAVAVLGFVAACAPNPPPGPGPGAGPESGGPPLEETGPVSPPPSGVTSFVTTGTLNFRSGPSMSAPVVGKIPGGTVIISTGNLSNDWWEVHWNGTTGWVYGRYLRPQ
jgi:uncharacterized protein YgiM (DUF1202 family)